MGADDQAPKYISNEVATCTNAVMNLSYKSNKCINFLEYTL